MDRTRKPPVSKQKAVEISPRIQSKTFSTPGPRQTVKQASRHEDEPKEGEISTKLLMKGATCKVGVFDWDDVKQSH
jgi:hypothetical protein